MEHLERCVYDGIWTMDGNKQILQSVDEWNLWLAPSEKNVSMHQVTYTMRDALYVSSVLITFFKHCKSVGMANLVQMVNVLPLIQTNKNAASFNPCLSDLLFWLVNFSAIDSRPVHSGRSITHCVLWLAVPVNHRSLAPVAWLRS